MTDASIRDTTELTNTAAKLARQAQESYLCPLDIVFLSYLINSDRTVRDHVLAVLAGHHPSENPVWLTEGPNDISTLERALQILEQLRDSSTSPATDHIDTMRAWVLWALHRPTQALTILKVVQPSRFAALLVRAITTCPPPALNQEQP